MNRKINDLISEKKDRKNIYLGLVLILLILGSVIGLLLVKSFVGYVYNNYMSGQAGYIYQVVLDYRECATMWTGVYGVAVMVKGYTNPQSVQVSSCGMYDINLLFDCMQPNVEHELMASQVPSYEIEWSTLQPATTEDVDNFLGISTTNIQSATRTFTRTNSYQIGLSYYTVPSIFTKKFNESSPINFDEGILKDGKGNIIFIATAQKNFTRGFNGKIYNYQMILPVRNGTNPVYYFFTDPNDVCPAGEGENPNPGYVIGNVTTTLGVPLPGVIVEVAGQTAVTDSNGFYNLTAQSGLHFIYGIKTGYQVYISNVSVQEAETIVHNMILVAEAVPNPNTGMGTSNGISNNLNSGPGENNNEGEDEPGTDVGPGEAPLVPVFEQPKRIEGVDYVISLSRIDRKLVIGNFLQEFVTFYSYKESPVELNFKIEDSNSSSGNLSQLIKLDKKSTVITPNSNDQVTLTIFGEGTPGVYTGSLVVEGGLNQKIPIRVELLTKDRLPVESLLLFIDVYNNEIFASDDLKFKVDLHNMLSDQSYPVALTFTIQTSNGSTIWTDHSNVYVQTSFSLIKTVKLPKNIPNGDYVIRVSANYLGLSSGTSAVFSVVSPFYQQYFLGMKIWLWILIVLLLLSAIIAGLLINRYIKSKKRYSAKVTYSELPKVGPKAAFVGKIAETEHKTYFDLEQFKVHTIVAGATGGGKSVAAQVIVEEALLKGVAVIVFDPTAQWSGMLRKCTDKNMMKIYPNFGLKPTDARAFNGNVRQITNALEVIDIKKYIKPGEIQILATNKLDPKDMDIFVANSVREIFHANFPETPEIKLLIVYDEVHRLLPKFGGSGEGFLQIERGCREFRKWGVGILMISQVLADFVGQIKANINTEIQMRTRDEGDLERIKTKYGTEVLQGLVKASVGSGMVENPAYNRGQPYFVSFRPLLHNTQRLPDEELEKYNKYNTLIEDLQYQLEQLEDEKQDVFDLKLELKLALDKVKSGNFNMVEIYLQELTPRVEKLWQKLGKKPKKREIKLVDVNSLKSELKKAEESRKEFEKNTASNQASVEKVEEKKVLKYDYQVPLNAALNFSNGVSVVSLQELLDVMPNISGPTFKHHVTKDKNDIADWIIENFGDLELADKIRSSQNNNDYVKILEEDRTKNNKPFTPKKLEQKKSEESSKSEKTLEISEDDSWSKIKSKLSEMNDQQKITNLEKILKKEPSEINVLFSLAILYHKTGKDDAAEELYKKILSIDKNNLKAMINLSSLYKRQKKYSRAVSILNNYLSIKKDSKIEDLVKKLSSKINA